MFQTRSMPGNKMPNRRSVTTPLLEVRGHAKKEECPSGSGGDKRDVDDLAGPRRVRARNGKEVFERTRETMKNIRAGRFFGIGSV